ncbi:MAG: hypothetical protein HY789_14880 [Deltaproteobacteria bacterium]|nr:hypothetical protein [Deltaproteobacteria bacterium]
MINNLVRHDPAELSHGVNKPEMHNFTVVGTFFSVIGGPQTFAGVAVINLQYHPHNRIDIIISHFLFHFRYSAADNDLRIKSAADYLDLFNIRMLIWKYAQLPEDIADIALGGYFRPADPIQFGAPGAACQQEKCQQKTE